MSEKSIISLKLNENLIDFGLGKFPFRPFIELDNNWNSYSIQNNTSQMAKIYWKSIETII